jgi:hypothetical protein
VRSILGDGSLREVRKCHNSYDECQMYLWGRLCRIEGYWYEWIDRDGVYDFELSISRITPLDDGPSMAWSSKCGECEVKLLLRPADKLMIQNAVDASDAASYAGVKVYDPKWPLAFSNAMGRMVQNWREEKIWP